MDRVILEGYFKMRLDTEDVGDILEHFDIDPLELLLDLYDKGLIDEESI